MTASRSFATEAGYPSTHWSHLMRRPPGENERQLVYALDMLRSVPDPTIVERVVPLLDHDSPTVRKKALEALQSQPSAEIFVRAQTMLNDHAPDVRAAALYYVCSRDEGGAEEVLAGYLQGPDLRLRAAAIACIAEHSGTDSGNLLSAGFLEQMLSAVGSDGAYIRRELAKALGSTNDPSLLPYLDRLATDRDVEVAREAIESLGRAKLVNRVPWLIRRLGVARLRRAARHALARLGDPARAALADALVDPTVPPAIRLNVPRVLASMGGQSSVEVLLRGFVRASPVLRSRIARALERLRLTKKGLDFAPAQVRVALVVEARWYYELTQIEDLVPARREDEKLLARALREARAETMSRMFRLLTLGHDAKDVSNSYLAITRGSRGVRASALEFLDNVLSREVKDFVVPFAEAQSLRAALRAGRALFGEGLRDVEGAHLRILASSDAWLKSTTLFTLRDTELQGLAPLVEQARSDPHPVVRETAELVLDGRV